MDYREKYLKYKSKYLMLQQQLEGDFTDFTDFIKFKEYKKCDITSNDIFFIL